jgi:predicted house-cleaning noncanonical NTP pyrophosphatase (MazG superfamily)
MTKKRYGKLVRDNIPAIIRADGAVPNVRVMDTDEYRRELCYKLIEEAEEVRKAADAFKDELPKEIADVLEVLYAIITEYGFSGTDIECIRTERVTTRGGFAQKLFLDSVDQDTQADMI